MFMHNAWYAAAWSWEVSRTLLARRICDRPMVLYRREDGSPVALEDLCCHRLLPLSHGRLEGDRLVCGYHGLTFDPSGQCVHMPSLQQPNARTRVASFPLVERYRLIWVWIGDPALADPAQVPDLHWNDDPHWAFAGDLLPMACDYRLVIDNLLDLTHETYVHPTSLGNEAIPAAPIETAAAGGGVTVTRWIMDHVPAPFWRQMIARARGYEGRCDRWQVVKFVPPSNCVLHVGVAEAASGARQGDFNRGVSLMQLNSITPATPTTSWYFWSATRNFLLDDQVLTKELHDASARIFGEDKTVIEAQQQAMIDNPAAATINISLDAGSVRMRRLIAQRGKPTAPRRRATSRAIPH